VGKSPLITNGTASAQALTLNGSAAAGGRPRFFLDSRKEVIVTDETAYWLIVHGPDARALAQAALHCQSDQEAMIVAFCTASPFGHELWSQDGFLGLFEPALSVAADTTPFV